MSSPSLPADATALTAARDAAVVCDAAALAVLAIAGRGRGEFPPRASSRTTSTRSRRTPASTRASIRRRAGCSRTSCSGGNRRRGLPRAAAGGHRRAGAQAPVDVRVALEGDACRRVGARWSGSAIGGPDRCAAIARCVRRRARAVHGRPSWTGRRARASGAALRRHRAGRRWPVDTREALSRHATRRPVRRLAMADDSRRRPGRDGGDAGAFVAQTANWDVLRRHQLPEGLLHRAGDHRAHAVSRPAKGARFTRSMRRQRTSPRARDSTARRSAISPAAPSSMRRRRRMAAATSSPSCRSPPASAATCALDAPDGPVLAPLPLPYAIPAPEAPRGAPARPNVVTRRSQCASR